MNFRNWPIAKQIGALAFILSLCVFSIVGASSYFSAKTILTNKSEHTIKANLNQISSLLELQYNSLLAIARRNANVFSDMYSGSITLSEQKTQVGQYQVPSLAHNGELINNNMNMVDRYADLTKGNATVFVRDGDDFFRIATSLKKDNGERAVGTYLGNKHPGYEKLIAGEEYEGYAKLFGNEYMTVYKPIKNSTNRVIGILYIGFNINDSLNALRESVANLTIEESGKLLLFNNANNTIIVGPHSQSGEQLTKQTLQGLPIEQTDSNEHVYYTDQHNEAMFALAKK
nr:Cache 3/Cache 2 fusion domain-containing protein [Lelliottia steviae]